MAAQRDAPLADIVATVLADLAEFRGETEVGDDVTLMLLRRSRA